MPGPLRHPIRFAGSSLLRLQADDRLVGLVRDGHDPAYAAIVERYREPLTRYAARLVGPDRGEDAVQQAFVNAHRAMTTSESDIELRPWLYRITHNAALNLLRASRDESALDEQQPAAGSVEDAVELRQRLSETLAAIHSLPARQRDAVLLRELEGRSHNEMATAMGVTSGAARQHLMRGRASLRAAASAITPYPLLVKVSAAMSSSAAGGGAELAAGAGLAAGTAKIAAGVLAAGALVGGAATGGVPFIDRGSGPIAPIARGAEALAAAPSASGSADLVVTRGGPGADLSGAATDRGGTRSGDRPARGGGPPALGAGDDEREATDDRRRDQDDAGGDRDGPRSSPDVPGDDDDRDPGDSPDGADGEDRSGSSPEPAETDSDGAESSGSSSADAAGSGDSGSADDLRSTDGPADQEPALADTEDSSGSRISADPDGVPLQEPTSGSGSGASLDAD